MYALLLKNHSALTNYRWDSVTTAKRDAQHVADGWHEVVYVVELDGEGFHTVAVVKPKTSVADVPAYVEHGNRTWTVERHKDKQ